MNEIRILIIVGGRLFREGLEKIVSRQFKVAGTAGSADDGLRQLDSGSEADLILLDGAGATPQLVTELRAKRPSVKIVVLLQNEAEVATVQRLKRSPVDGFIIATVSTDTLEHSLRMVMHDQFVLPRSVARVLFSESSNDTADRIVFSPREIDILRHLGAGSSNKLIANSLNISVATVKVHVKSVLRKIRVDNRTQAALWAVERAHALRPD